MKIKLEEIVDIHKLKQEGLSERKISEKTGYHRKTVRKYLKLKEVPPVQARALRPGKLDAFKTAMGTWLKEDGDYSAVWIYDHLVPLGFTGSYEIVKRWVHKEKETLHRIAYERFETLPGVQAQVDFGEFKVNLPDGSALTLYLFSMILGYGRHIYGELLLRCDLPTFLDCHMRAFAHFGGAPQEILYDRMRNVYIGKLAGKRAFNPSLLGFSLHYGFTPMVAPAYAAWVKGKIERPYTFIREGFWRGYVYTGLNRGNHDLSDWLDMKADRVHGTVKEVVRTRFLREKPFLQPLPVTAFDTSWRLYRTVHKDCTVHYNQNLYVVAHHLVGKKVLLRVKEDSLRIFDDDLLIVTYTVPDGKGHLVQDPKFYQALRNDKEMTRRKYQSGKRTKGRAHLTISPCKPEYEMDVEVRPIQDYTQASGGFL